MKVDVAVNVPGEIIESIPLYPEGGWKEVTAYPGGKLEYQGKNYAELFYEASVTPIDPPQAGFVVEKKNLKIFLSDLTYKLGLEEKEQKEFLSYWLPRLEQFKEKYVFISVFNQAEKKKIDDVRISPAPDTFIEFILYFKPVEKFFVLPSLQLPSRPERVGFTAVEWGGIIDSAEQN